MAAIGIFSGTLLTVEGGVGYIQGFAGPEMVRISADLISRIAVGTEVHYFAVDGEDGPLAVRVIRIGRQKQ